MADNFGLKIGVEGEKEFKKALAEINQTFKAVSYTHLDVYKRQPRRCAGTPRRTEKPG